MKKVVISENGTLNFYCPMSFSFDGTGINCFKDCAWFRIEDSVLNQNISVSSKYAHCGSKLIGEIKQ